MNDPTTRLLRRVAAEQIPEATVQRVAELLYVHSYSDGGPPGECGCGAKLDTLSARAMQWHQARVVLAALTNPAETGGAA